MGFEKFKRPVMTPGVSYSTADGAGLSANVEALTQADAGHTSIGEVALSVITHANTSQSNFYTLPTPVPGREKRIVIDNNSTEYPTIVTASSDAGFVGATGSNTLTFTSGFTSVTVDLVGYTTALWAIGNVSSIPSATAAGAILALSSSTGSTAQ